MLTRQAETFKDTSWFITTSSHSFVNDFSVGCNNTPLTEVFAELWEFARDAFWSDGFFLNKKKFGKENKVKLSEINTDTISCKHRSQLPGFNSPLFLQLCAQFSSTPAGLSPTFSVNPPDNQTEPPIVFYLKQQLAVLGITFCNPAMKFHLLILFFVTSMLKEVKWIGSGSGVL